MKYCGSAKYKGVLLERLPALSRGMLRNDDLFKHEFERRIRALLEHYEIPAKGEPVDWCELALRLACDHVLGFQTAGRRGRPSKEIEKREPRRALLDLCETHKELRDVNEKDAAKWLMRHPKALPPYYRNLELSDDTIRSEIRAAKKQRQYDAEFKESIRLSREAAVDL